MDNFIKPQYFRLPFWNVCYEIYYLYYVKTNYSLTLSEKKANLNELEYIVVVEILMFVFSSICRNRVSTYEKLN